MVPSGLVFLPARWLVLTGVILVSMWWIGYYLSGIRMKWKDFNDKFYPRLIPSFWRKKREPPDKPVLGSRRAYDERLIAAIMENSKQGPKSQEDRDRLALKALHSAVQLADAQPVIMTSNDKRLRRRLRSKRRNGMLLMSRVSEDDKTRLLNIMLDAPRGLLSKSDFLELIVDTGCTLSASGTKSDFIKETMVKVPPGSSMQGVGGNLEITHKGTLRFEVLDDSGGLRVLETTGFYAPGLGMRLFSPQVYFREIREKGDTLGRAGLKMTSSSMKLRWPDGGIMTIPYDRRTFLPIIRGFIDATASARLLAQIGCVTNDNNTNLTRSQKFLLGWHFRLGHLDFKWVQWLGLSRYLGPGDFNKAQWKTLPAVKCASCQFGKQARGATKHTHVKHEPTGALSNNVKNPGDRVFMDSYECRLPGRAFTSRGHPSSTKYAGGTIFVDAASGYVFVSHQVGQTAGEAIQSKMRFEREASTCGVAIKSYHTDNGVFNSKEFMAELLEKNQGIRFSGVSAHFQNGVAERAIKTVTQKARTMMIHAALRWPRHAQRDLWPMAMSHAAYLHNATPHYKTGYAPIEAFTGTKLKEYALKNEHTWGCPVYVLSPKLKDGHKIPKWDPRSRKGQYMGKSPVHASNVGLVRNLKTGTITPQFHMVYDDLFETVHTSEEEQPTKWEELFVTNRFRSELEDGVELPDLQDEWLNEAETLQRSVDSLTRRNQDLETTIAAQRRADDSRRAQRRHDAGVTLATAGEPQASAPSAVPEEVEMTALQEETDSTRAHAGSSIIDEDPSDPYQAELGTAPEAVSAEASGRPQRIRTRPDRFDSESNYTRLYGKAKAAIALLVIYMAQSMQHVMSTAELDYRYHVALLTDPDTGVLDGFTPDMIGQYPFALKAKKGNDPDLPTYEQAMNGEHRAEFREAMKVEIEELTTHKTWKIMPKSKVPKDAKILPSTWVLRVKRYPDGRLRKFKARFCVRGDRQVEGEDYDEKYSPVVAWSTVRMMLTMALNQNLVTRQVDFSNAFVQANLSPDEHIYVAAPRGFDYEPTEGENAEPQVLKLRKSLYGLVQAPLYWGNYLRSRLESVGFKQSTCDPCMYYAPGVIALTYVDDVLFFGRNADEVDAKIKKIQDQGLQLTIEQDIYAFLGVEVERKNTGEIEMTQKGLIRKILKTCNMEDCNTKATPCNMVPIGADLEGPEVTGKFEYSSVVGVLMYLSSNSRPDIQFAVHQCARFSHFPKKSHEDAILRLCRYLKGTMDKGLIMKPDSDMKLDCYVDADFAGLYNAEDHQDPVCVKSRTGYCLTLGSCPVIWVSKLQTEIALSTVEAEYIALSQSMRDLLPMRRLLQEAGEHLDLDFAKPAIIHSTVFEDNSGAMSLATSPKMNPRTKHIAIKYHHFREHVGEDKGILICKIDTSVQKADIFTKGLSAEVYAKIRTLLMGW